MHEVEVLNGTGKTFPIREQLKSYGLSFSKTGKYTGKWLGNVNDSQFENLTALCDNAKVILHVIEKPYSRSHDYTKTFFSLDDGFKGDKNTYHCSYCGKILYRNKGEVTVDHLFSIASVQNTSFWHKRIREYLLKKNITDINQIENLVPSCKRCNLKKGKKVGLWVVRGMLGRNYVFWKIMYTIILTITSFTAVLLILYFISRL